jgi:type I restriction enzyme S subunit
MTWRSAKLSEVADIERDGIASHAIETGTRYLGLEHIEAGGRILSAATVDAGDLASTKFWFTSRHVLYGKLRPYLAKIATPDFDGICSTDIVPIMPGPRLDRSFLTHWLRQPSMIEFANSRTTGANLPRLSPKALADFEIPLPPLEEQKRIAAILDQADELRRKRQRALDRLNQLSQAVFIEMFGEQFESFEQVRLDDVASQIDYGLTASAETSGAGPKFLRITDIQNGRVDWEAVPVCAASPKQLIDNKLAAGDIVFARTGATTGKSFLIERCPEDAVFASYLIRVRPATSIEPEFLFGFFQSRSYWAQISGMAEGAAQPGVNSSKLKELRLPLPSIEAQRKYKAARQTIAQQKGGLSSSLTSFDRLFASLQHRAFRGGL